MLLTRPTQNGQELTRWMGKHVAYETFPKFDKSHEMDGEARCLRGLSQNRQGSPVSGCGLHLQLLSQR